MGFDAILSQVSTKEFYCTHEKIMIRFLFLCLKVMFFFAELFLLLSQGAGLMVMSLSPMLPSTIHNVPLREVFW